jgi:hypothetical protein
MSVVGGAGLVEPEKGVLDGIFGILALSEETECHGVGTPMITTHEIGERLPVTILDVPEQRLIGFGH